MLAWTQLPCLPDAVGFASPFAGGSNGVLLVGGGANFAEKPPWAGGTKVWHDGIFVFDRARGAWTNGLRLARPLAYGVSVDVGDGLLCIGGSDARRHYADVFHLEWKFGTVRRRTFPSLPHPCAMAAGARVGDRVYVAGGMIAPDATGSLHTFWSLDLNRLEEGWRQLPAWPGPARMLAVAGAHGDGFYLFSGTRLFARRDGRTDREFLRDAWRYRPESGWTRLADLPRPAVAAPSPAAAIGDGQLLVLGGDDGKHFNQDLRERHPGFPTDVLAYHAPTDTWSVRGQTPAPYVTTPLVPWQGGFVVPGGESMPGTRTTNVQFAVPI